MPIGASFTERKGAMSCISSSRLSRTTGMDSWLSTSARPWPGMCLMTPATPPASSPSSAARGKDRHLVWIVAERAVADDVVLARVTQVDNRRAVGADAHRLQLGGDEAVVQPHGVDRGFAVCLPQFGILARRRKSGQTGSLRRRTRPPSWSMKISASRPSTDQMSCVSASTCSRLSQERPMRMTPQGLTSEKSLRSPSVSFVPETLRIQARGFAMKECSSIS